MISKEQVQKAKDTYLRGMRVRLLKMEDMQQKVCVETYGHLRVK